MNIGIDASRAFIEQKTGTEWYSYHVIKNMIDNDPHNTYTLYTKNNVTQLPFTNSQGNIIHKRLAWLPKYGWTHGRLSLEMLTNQPDLLFVPSHTIPYYTSKKSVLTVHDLAFEYFPYLYSKREYNYHIWSLQKAMKQVTQIITISENTKNDICERYNFPENRIHVIHNGFDANQFKPIPDNHRNKLVLKKYINTATDVYDESRYISYVGRIESKKNILRLIQAFENIRQIQTSPVKLLLIGKPGFGYEKIIEYIKARRLEKVIYLLGWVKETDLAHLINASDVYAFPSLYEGFGIPILEAMACGVPVAAAYSGALPEIGGDAALYFDPNDLNDITNKILLLLNTPDLRKDLIQKGFRQCDKFSWKKCAKNTINVLNNIL